MTMNKLAKLKTSLYYSLNQLYYGYVVLFISSKNKNSLFLQTFMYKIHFVYIQI